MTASTAFINAIHILRVGSDASSADMIAHQWNSSSSTVYAASDAPPYYTATNTQTGQLVQIDEPFLITNADTGAVLSWDVDIPNASGVADTIEYHLTTTAGENVASDVVWNAAIPNQANQSVIPVLQLADGSFVGSVDTGGGNTMVAFDASGNVRWTVPGYKPDMATADGGIVADTGPIFSAATGTFLSATFSTFDANGNASGQLPSFPTLSWKGAYQIGSVESVVPLLLTVLPSYAAVPNGNLTGNGTALVHHSFALWWCGAPPLGQSSCPGGNDVSFSYATTPISDIGSLQSFASAHPDWVTTIKSQALGAYTKAFSQYAVTVYGRVSFHSGFLESNILDQEFAAKIVGDWPVPAAALEFPTTTFGRIYYVAMMGEAQTASGHGQGGDCTHDWCGFYPPYPPTTPGDIAGFPAIIKAIGKGIGNAAAHETGHFLQGVPIPLGNRSVFPYMDCGLANRTASPINCEGGDNFVYSFYSASGINPVFPSEPTDPSGRFFYVDIPNRPTIHWGPENDCWLRNYMSPGGWAYDAANRICNATKK